MSLMKKFYSVNVERRTQGNSVAFSQAEFVLFPIEDSI